MTRVYVHLIGGLGNQMFQYAAARAVTLRNDADLILDTTRTPMKGGGGESSFGLRSRSFRDRRPHRRRLRSSTEQEQTGSSYNLENDRPESEIH